MNEINSIDNNIDDSEESIRRAFNFLLNHSRIPEAFSKEEFKRFANYQNPKNFNTYFSKKFRHLLEKAPNEKNKYLVAGVFRKFSRWQKFRRYYSQSSKIKVNYIEEYYEKLMIFDFFIPLTNENDLRSSLDELFYSDTVKLMLNKILKNELNIVFPIKNKESEEQYIERICEWISKRFGGYSIGTARGRFKIDDLKTFAEVALQKTKGFDYLIDETTAIVHFIFHVGPPIKNQVLFNIEQFQENLDEYYDQKEIELEANQIRFIFKNSFVRNILDLVNGEDEIWMLESGIRNCLYIWRSNSQS